MLAGPVPFQRLQPVARMAPRSVRLVAASSQRSRLRACSSIPRNFRLPSPRNRANLLQSQDFAPIPSTTYLRKRFPRCYRMRMNDLRSAFCDNGHFRFADPRGAFGPNPFRRSVPEVPDLPVSVFLALRPAYRSMSVVCDASSQTTRHDASQSFGPPLSPPGKPSPPPSGSQSQFRTTPVRSTKNWVRSFILPYPGPP